MKAKEMYDFLIVGAGLFGCVCAKELTERGYRVLVIDKRGQVGGNCAVTLSDGQIEHLYGPHIFHTDNKTIWDYLNDIEPLVPYRHKVVAVNHGLQYDFPINRCTLSKLFGDNICLPSTKEVQPSNFEEAAISRVGEKLYRLFYRDYTAKQWGRDPQTLPAEIFSRVPVRYDYNDCYFNDRYSGVIADNALFDKMLSGASVRLNCPYSAKKHAKIARYIIYTGMIDEFYQYRFGRLPYRSLRFERRKVALYENQGIAVVNYTDSRPYTRTCEYGYMYKQAQWGGFRWYEFPLGEYNARRQKTEPYYPLPTQAAQSLYQKYAALSQNEAGNGAANVCFGGRLGSYKYINMDQAVEQALQLVREICTPELLKNAKEKNNERG